MVKTILAIGSLNGRPCTKWLNRRILYHDSRRPRYNKRNQVTIDPIKKYHRYIIETSQQPLWNYT